MTRTRLLAARAGAAALTALLLGACGGTPTRYYTLAEAAPVAAPAPAASASFAIEMAPIALAERLARPQLVVRKADAPEAQVEILEQSRWSSSFENELRDALGAGIAARLSAVDATRTGNGRGLPLYRIAVQVRRFDALEGRRVDGDFGWTLRRTDGDVQLACQLALTEPATDGGVAGLASGAQRITARLADAIAASVAALAAQQPARCSGLKRPEAAAAYTRARPRPKAGPVQMRQDRLLPMMLPAMTPEEPSPRLRVLVVEDEPDTLATVLESLELLGHSGTGVRSAEMARARYLDGAFDVLLTDVGLPAVSGLELVEVLSRRSPELQVIVASGRPRPSAERLPWLTKPYGIDELDAALKQAADRLGRLAAHETT